MKLPKKPGNPILPLVPFTGQLLNLLSLRAEILISNSEEGVENEEQLFFLENKILNKKQIYLNKILKKQD